MQREASKRETADAQKEKGEKIWTFKIIVYASYYFILQKLWKINYKNIGKIQIPGNLYHLISSQKTVLKKNLFLNLLEI